ncbi:MAG: hypothetical protein IT460_02810 [Planctomycetes bacterium]|nr:hypothetical protein [Planctomycetota bacterium]
MFGRKKTTRRTGPLLLAAVVARLASSTATSPEDLVHRLCAFLDGVGKAALATGGHILQSVGNVALVAWRVGLGSGGCTVDPLGTATRVLDVVRRGVASPDAVRLCVAMALGECSYGERGGRVIDVTGTAWLRVAKDFVPALGGDEDAIVLDRSLRDVLALGRVVDVGDGWSRVTGPVRS